MVSHDISTLQGAGMLIASLINFLPEIAGVFGGIYIFRSCFIPSCE